MMDKIYRSIALAVLAAITVGVAANADGCQPPQKKVSYRACKRISHRPAKTIAEKPALIKETKVTNQHGEHVADLRNTLVQRNG